MLMKLCLYICVFITAITLFIYFSVVTAPFTGIGISSPAPRAAVQGAEQDMPSRPPEVIQPKIFGIKFLILYEYLEGVLAMFQVN